MNIGASRNFPYPINSLNPPKIPIQKFYFIKYGSIAFCQMA